LFARAPSGGGGGVPTIREADFDHPDHTFTQGLCGRKFSPAQIKPCLPAGPRWTKFCVEGREYYWLCRIKSNESKVWVSPQMKIVKPATSSMRNLTTCANLRLSILFPEFKKTGKYQHVPGLRSPSAKVGGLVYFGSMLDKIRLHAAGKLPSDYNVGTDSWWDFDSRCTRFLGIDYDQLVKRSGKAGPISCSSSVLQERTEAHGRRF